MADQQSRSHLAKSCSCTPSQGSFKERALFKQRSTSSTSSTPTLRRVSRGIEKATSDTRSDCTTGDYSAFGFEPSYSLYEKLLSPQPHRTKSSPSSNHSKPDKNPSTGNNLHPEDHSTAGSGVYSASPRNLRTVKHSGTNSHLALQSQANDARSKLTREQYFTPRISPIQKNKSTFDIYIDSCDRGNTENNSNPKSHSAPKAQVVDNGSQPLGQHSPTLSRSYYSLNQSGPDVSTASKDNSTSLSFCSKPSSSPSPPHRPQRFYDRVPFAARVTIILKGQSSAYNNQLPYSINIFSCGRSLSSSAKTSEILNIKPFLGKQELMASAEVDTKFLGKFADNIKNDHPLLSQSLNKILGNLTMVNKYILEARRLRRLDTARNTKSLDLYNRITWYAREGLEILRDFVLPMVANYGELKVLTYKIRASFYHLYVLFHNYPQISLKRGGTVSTPPGLKSPRALKIDKGKGIDRGPGSPSDPYRPSSVQPTHPIEQGGPVGGTEEPYLPPDANFLVPADDYRPIALACFQEAASLAEHLVWGSHPLRLSVKVEFCAFMYDCLHERESSRQLAKQTIAEVYNAQEGMDDEMFEDAAQLVGILGKMAKRGTAAASGSAGGTGSTKSRGDVRVASPGMDNPI